MAGRGSGIGVGKSRYDPEAAGRDIACDGDVAGGVAVILGTAQTSDAPAADGAVARRAPA
jgi:hypothetical protein